MAKMLVPNDGVQGIDIQTESGKTSYNADKSGRIEVTDPKHRKSLKANGFTDAATVGFAQGDDHPCINCGFNSVFAIYTCPKCETENDFSKE